MVNFSSCMISDTILLLVYLSHRSGLSTPPGFCSASLTLLLTSCIPLSVPRKSPLSLIRHFAIFTLSVPFSSSLKASLPSLFSSIHNFELDENVQSLSKFTKRTQSNTLHDARKRVVAQYNSNAVQVPVGVIRITRYTK